jgi:Glycosyl hydrolases family 2, sugar binding domain/Glycosyl hydrolases family 2/Glycosyl hydrolases family 2, TIM barrel domain
MRRLFAQPAALAFLAVCLASISTTAKTVPLDGDWVFVPDPAANLHVADLAHASGIPVHIPSSWQASFVDRRDYAGVAWYWRNVSVEPPPAGQLLSVRFGAVDYRADVYVNGRKVGSHDGGYLPFEFDITSLVHSGENQLAVRVADPGGAVKEVEGIKYAEIPHGKQSWYVQTSGPWQSVELDTRPDTFLGTIHISGDAAGSFTVRVAVQNPRGTLSEPPTVTAQMLDPAGKEVWKGQSQTGGSEITLAGHLANVTTWSLSNPALYSLHVTLSSGDERTIRFGFRTFEARDGKFYLNGKATYLRGALDQDFYPDTAYSPPSLDFVRDEMRKAKALGLNLLRCHIKVPDPRYLEAADEEGMLIWYEIPNWDKLTPDSESRALATLQGMADRDWNHPSIVIVSIVNESWGINLKTASDREWLKSAYARAKQIVPGWLVDDNSACCDNYHVVSDLADFHQYDAIPDHAGDFDRLVGDFATRPRWLFSPYGDAEPKGDEPLLLSEFGNWGLPRLHDPEPWWFSRNFGGNPNTLPAGVTDRFIEYQFRSLFPDLNALTDATEWAQYRALKYEIGSLRIHPEIQGYVITEFTDVNWESNGLLDMWRQPKIYGSQIGKLQQDDLVVARAEKRNYYAGEQAEAEVYFSHYSENSLAGAMVSWELEGTDRRGESPLPAISGDSATLAEKIRFRVPAVTAPSSHLLKVRVAAGGKTISENSLHFYFYPRKGTDLPPPVSFHDPAGRLRRLVNEMRERGYQPPSGRESFPVLISSAWDEEVKQKLQAGEIVILMPSDAMTLAPGLEIVPRSQDDLSGNWISSFLWIRKDHPPFEHIGFDTLPGFETQSVTPNTVVKGVPAENFDDLISGIFYGWIHSNVGALVQAKCGKGKLLISTYSLGTTYGTDPYATYFLDQLVSYAVSGFTPRYRIPPDESKINAPQ